MTRRSLQTSILTAWLLSLAVAAQVAPAAPFNTQEMIFLIGDNRLSEALEMAQLAMVRSPQRADGYYFFCQVLEKTDRLAWGEKYFLGKLQRDPDHACLNFALGYLYQLRLDYHQAAQFLEKSLTEDVGQEYPFEIYLNILDVLGEEMRGLQFLNGIYRRDPGNFLVSSSIAELYLYVNDYPKFNEWLKLTQSQNPDYFGTVLLTAHRLSLEGRDEEAIRFSLDWLGNASSQGKLRDEAYLLTQLGNLYLSLNRYEEAIEIIHKSFNYCTIIGDQKLRRVVEELYASYYRALGHYALALDHYGQVLAYAERVRHVKTQADMHQQIGSLHELMGDYQNAYDAYNQALILAIKVQQPYLQTVILKNLADLKLTLNELDEAERFYQQSLLLAEKMQDPYTRCVLLDALGRLADRRKDYPRGMEYFLQAEALAKEVRFEIQRGLILLDIAWNNYKSGKNETVMPTIDAAMAIFRHNRWEAGLIEASHMQGIIHYRQNQYPEAIGHFEDAQKISTRLRLVPMLADSITGIGACYRKMKRIPEAIQCYERALQMLEEMQNTLQNYQEKVRFGDDLFTYYEALISIYTDLYAQERKPEWLAKTFEYSEQAKARTLSTAIARSRLAQRMSGISPALHTQFLLANKKLELKHREYRDAENQEAGAPESARLRLRTEISLLEKQRTAFLEKLRREDPRFFQLVDPGLVPLASFQQSLVADAAAIEFFVGEKETYYWVIRRDGVHQGRLGLNREKLNELLRLASHNLYSPKSLDPAGDFLKNQRWAGIATRGLHGLFLKLLGPLEAHLEGVRQLLIIPDEKLHYLPFEMLVHRWDKTGQPRFLLEKYTINYVPYAGIARSFPTRGQSPAGLSNVLLLGNPDFSEHVLASRPEPSRYLFQLPYSEQEARDIHSLIPESALFLGKAATETKFKENATRFRVLHPSTHNFLDDRQPFYSRLVFASDPEQHEDGSLYTYEIFNLNLSANLVVLSGCETGLGLLSRGEGIMGLNRAFLYAGASSLVVSLWPVGDEHTAQFMTTFYRQLWSGAPKSEALREAKLEMIRDPLSRDPFYWAPFILMGDAGPVPFTRPRTPAVLAGLIIIGAALAAVAGIYFLRR